MKTRHQFAVVRVIASQMLATSPRATVVSVVLMLAMTFMEGIGLLLLLPLLELIGVVQENPLPRAAGGLASLFAVVGLTPTLGSVLVFFVVVVGARSLLARLQFRLNAVVREELINAYRLRLYRALVGADWTFLATKNSAELVQVLSAEVNRLGAAATRVSDIAVAVAAASIYIALALRVSPTIAVIVLAGAALLAWMMRGSLIEASRTGALLADARREMHKAVTEHVMSLKWAHAFGAVQRQNAAFRAVADTTRRRQLLLASGETDLQQDLELGSTVVLAAIVFIAIEFVGEQPAVLLLTLYSFARLMPRLVSIYRHVQGLLGLLPSYDVVVGLEAECLAAADGRTAPQLPMPPLSTRIQFEAVSFVYPGRTSAAVKDITGSFEVGETTAIIGPSGAGKSTIADLMLGLLSPTSGRILVDGRELTPSLLDAWRQQVGYVAQDTFFFQATVRDNLLWACPSATEDELWLALRQAAAESVVANLPQRLDTMIGERGVTLSGGERQRLAIARALLRKPKLLVLDEATSALDPDNEAQIQRAIDALQHRMTIVVIAHRASTIRHADVVHMVDGGRMMQDVAHPSR